MRDKSGYRRSGRTRPIGVYPPADSVQDIVAESRTSCDLSAVRDPGYTQVPFALGAFVAVL
jgi:hypothetical protein